ncbi:MAG: tetratricopeptide repeat protein [Gammaproteobacteria bacterium]
MVEFWLVGAVLVVLSIVVLLWPLFRARSEANVTLVMIFILFGLPIFAVLMYQLSSTYDWENTDHPAIADAAETGEAPPVEDLVAELEARLADRPDDLEGWVLLGRSLMSMERYAEGQQAMARAYEISGGTNSVVNLDYAEAMILADRSQLQGEAATLIELVLDVQPTNPKALWYGGMTAAAGGDRELAADRWRQLLNMDLPERERAIIQQQLAAMTGEAPPQNVIPEDAASAALRVHIEISPELADKVAPGATLFVIARNGDQPGPPLAVVRQGAGSFPVDVRMTQANVMLPGVKLTDAAEVRLTARISASGDAIAAPGDMFGETSWQADWSQEAELKVTIDAVMP